MFTVKVNFFVIYLISVVIFVNGYKTFNFDENEINDKTCIISNSGLQGICIPFSQCNSAQMTFQNHKINSTNCYYNNLEQVVCCSDIFKDKVDHQNCRKSIIQCHKSSDGQGIFNTGCWEAECKRIITNFEFEFRQCKTHSAANGVSKRIGDYPFVAAIGVRKHDGIFVLSCGGFLVTRNFVITAAQCTRLVGHTAIVVRTGGIDLDIITKNDLDIPVTQIYIHPLYNSKQAYNDIAVLQLEEPSNDKSKCLDNGGFFDYTDIPVIAVGYGHISFGHTVSNRLLEVNLTVVSNEDCKKAYPVNAFLPKGILPSQVCAIYRKTENIQDTCHGDFGGPLLTFLAGVPKLFAVTSFGDICNSKTPGVYTRIEFYYDWLESIIWADV